MEIKNPNSAVTPLATQPTKLTAPLPETDSNIVRLPGNASQDLKEYRLKLLDDMESLNSLEIPELKKRLENSSLKHAIQSYTKAETVPERRIWELRLRELSVKDTRLVRAEQTQATADKKKESSWNDDLKRVDDPENRSVANLSDLFKQLKIDENSPQARALRNLTIQLWQQGERGSDILGYMLEIARDHGLNKLISICQTLEKYMSEQWNKDGPVDIGELVSCALRDVAHPNGIGQDGKGSCAASSIQCKLAAERPEQYVEMLTKLASGKTYTAPGGQAIRPNESWVGDKTDNRRLSEKIMQNAMMDQRGRPYDSKKDISYKADDEEGMYDSEIETAIEKIFGFRDRAFDSASEGYFTSKNDMWNYIQDDLARGRPVSVSFKGHAVLVTGFDPTQKPPQVLIATWGKSFSMDLDDFLRHVQAIRTDDNEGLDNRKLPTNRRTSVLEDAA